MSRFNTLYMGEPEEVLAELDADETTQDELRIALCNAMDRIARLERQVANLREAEMVYVNAHNHF